MDPRKFLLALALGLPTAVLAHAMSFGSGHTLGGDAHQLVIEASLAGGCAGVLALFFGILYASAGNRNGSIVTAKLTKSLPGWGAVCGFAAVWFALIERAEASHGLSLGLVTVAIALASIVVHSLIGYGLRAIAGLVVEILAVPFFKRPLLVRLHLTPAPRAIRRPVVPNCFSRPPPLLP